MKITLNKKIKFRRKIVAVYENGFITIKRRMENTYRTPHVPLTLGGKAKFMIANVLLH
jgi:cyanophycin synthetase